MLTLRHDAELAILTPTVIIPDVSSSRRSFSNGHNRHQCSGSVGSICFWASWIRILQSQSRNSKKTLIPTVLWLLFDFLSLKNDVNVPSESKKQKNILLVFVGVLTKNVMDPQLCSNRKGGGGGWTCPLQSMQMRIRILQLFTFSGSGSKLCLSHWK